MGRSDLLSTCLQSNAAKPTSCGYDPPTSPSPLRTCPSLVGADMLASLLAPTPVSETTHGAVDYCPPTLGIKKSLSGLSCAKILSPFSVGGNTPTPHPGDGIVADKNAEEYQPAIPGCGQVIGPDANELQRKTVPSRVGLSKGSANTGTKSPPTSSGPSANENVLNQHARASESHVNYGSWQARPPRNPTSKALLLTADSAPSLGINHQLGYTANDSERFKACLREIGFEEIRVVKAIGFEYLSRSAVMEGLDFLLSGAVDDDMLVVLVSTHGFRSHMGVHLEMQEHDGSLKFMGTREFVEIINSNLREVRCTVEIVLDICYAAGLIRCKHVIRKMESEGSAIVISTSVEEEVLSPVPISPFSLASRANRKEARIPAGHLGPYAPMIMNFAGHVNQAVVAGPPSVPFLPTMPIIPPAPTSSSLMQKLCAYFVSPPELQTESTVMVWAAAGENQKAFERLPSGTEKSNGGLVAGVCMALEKGKQVSRLDVFDQYAFPVMEEMNDPSEPQHIQLLSNHNYRTRILKGNIFQALPRE